jgi:enoyl-CoA hydratase/carnithine racemase
MTNQTVLTSVSNHVATISLNRPEVRNAVDLFTAQSFEAAIDAAEADDDVRVIVLAGVGPVFCAGMDLKAFSATGARPVTDGRGAFGITGRPPSKPTIAAVEGKAFGGGFEIALAADLIVAAESAMFGLPEVKRGLVAAAGGLLRLPHRVPRNVAMHMAFTGEPISSAQALGFGLAASVVPDGTAADAAQALGSLIAANAPLALIASKQIMNESPDWRVDEMFERQATITGAVRVSNDAAEGAKAFLEKRAPQWSGT